MAEERQHKAGDQAGQKAALEESVGLDATLDGQSVAPSQGLAQTMDSGDGPARPSPVTVSVSDSLRGLRWDRYEILSLLGRGGMGAVYKARDRRLGRVVALKFIRGDDEGMTQRFVQEARAQSRIDHPFVCKVHEVGEVEGRPYIAMQLVEGEPLERICKTLRLHEKVQLIRDVALALHAAHEQNIIHRDIKPSNIMVEKAQSGALRPVVMDFGLAREAGEGKGLTESGAVMGTPAYMSPEQARGETRHLDRRSDVYSLGATLYDILTGVPPFDADAVVKILIKVVNEAPAPLRSHDAKLPESLELIVSKCLNKEAAQRYPTAQALAEDLDRFLSAGRVAARRLGYGYRIRYFARHNRALFSLGVALSLSILCLGGFFTYTRIVNARKAAQARRQAELLRELGQDIKDLEWLMRAAHALPLHDIEREKAQVRQRMAALGQRFAEGSEGTAGLIAYGKGRGHLALHEYAQAHTELVRAESLGSSLPELHLALGRVQGELYERALSDARRSGDASFFEKRRQELEREFLQPALAHLEAVKRSGARLESPHYLEGLIAFYTKKPEAALRHADAALAQDGWLYEAKKLSGDVFLSRALDEKDSGQHEKAEADFAEAVKRYEQAADIGRSDHGIYESIAEAWIRQMDMDVERGRDPSVKYEQALRAAEKSIAASSKASLGATKQAFANLFMSRYYIVRDELKNGQNYNNKMIEAGKFAIELDSNNAYAHEVVGIGYFQKAQIDPNESVKLNLERARKYIESAIQIYPRFAWAYNDLALAIIVGYSLDAQSGQENINELEIAKKYLKKAIEIDNKYINAYVNLAQACRLSGEWLAEHGLNPQAAVMQAVESAQASLQINKNIPGAFVVIAAAYLWQSVYGAMNGSDVSIDIDRSIEAIRKIIDIDATNVVNYGDASYAYFVKSKYAKSKSADALSAGLELNEKCLRLDAKYAPCLWTKALLTSSADPTQARTFAMHAVETALPEQIAEANFTLASILYERALQGQTASLRTQDLDAGLHAAALALKQNRSWPRALGVQGGLAWLRAKPEKNSARREEFIRLAGASLKQALQGNPLLKRQYEGALRELLAAPNDK